MLFEASQGAPSQDGDLVALESRYGGYGGHGGHGSYHGGEYWSGAHLGVLGTETVFRASQTA